MNLANISYDEYLQLKAAYEPNSSEAVITITLDKYLQLVDADQTLDALYAAGVDNWEGYDIAMEMKNEG